MIAWVVRRLPRGGSVIERHHGQSARELCPLVVQDVVHVEVLDADAVLVQPEQSNLAPVLARLPGVHDGVGRAALVGDRHEYRARFVADLLADSVGRLGDHQVAVRAAQVVEQLRERELEVTVRLGVRDRLDDQRVELVVDRQCAVDAAVRTEAVVSVEVVEPLGEPKDRGQIAGVEIGHVLSL